MQMLSKIAVVAAFATSALAAPDGSYGADGQWTTCTDEEQSTAPPAPVTTSASSPPSYETPSSYAAPPTSSTPVSPVSSSSSPAPSSYASPSSSPASPVSSSPAPSGTPAFPSCWTKVFEENGNPSEDELCGNSAVSDCIKNTCDAADAAQYESWLAGYCGVPSSSSSVPVGPTTSSSVYVPSSYPATGSSSTPATSSAPPPSSYESKTSSTPASPETTSSAPAPPSYGTGSYSAPASSSTPVSPIGTGTPNMPGCWSACFEKNGVSSEAALCGNGAVGECIKETCSAGDVSQYKQWLASYCVGASGSSPVVGPTGSYPPQTTTTDVTTIYTTTCPVSSEYTSESSTLTSYWTTVSTVTTTYQVTKTIPGGYGPTSSPASPAGPSSYPVSTVVNTETMTYTLGHGSSTSVYTTTIESTSTIYQTSTVYMTMPTESATEGSPVPTDYTSGGTEYSVSGTKTFTISSTSTLTNFVTVYPAGSTPAGGYPAPSSPAGGEGTCAPQTVTVTESEVVTVTVGGGSGSGEGYPTGSTVGPIQSSSAPYYPTNTYPVSSGVASPSGFVTKTKSSAAPSGTGSGDCWGTCFSQNGISSKDALCGNDAVTGCIADTCGAASSAAYDKWLGEYCPAASTSSTPAGPVTTSSAPAPPAYETSSTASTPASPVTTSSAPAPPAYETSSSASTPASPVTTSSAPAAPPAYTAPVSSSPSTPAAPVTTSASVPAYTAPPAYSFAPESSSSAAAAPPAYTKL